MNPESLSVNVTKPELTALIKALRYDIEENGSSKIKEGLLRDLLEGLNISTSSR